MDECKSKKVELVLCKLPAQLSSHHQEYDMNLEAKKNLQAIASNRSNQLYEIVAHS
jgi:hypothetical protein